MKVVRPEWLVDSVSAGSLLPWQKYIFQPVARLEGTQGGKTTQKNLIDGFISQADRNTEGSSGIEISGSGESIQRLGLHSTTSPPIELSPKKSPLKTTFPATAQSPSKSTTITSPLSNTDSNPQAQALRPGYAAHDSNPNAQRVMANPSWRSAHTSAAPDFIQGFYKNSRLHHLSTWKAELKGLVAEALVRAERSGAAAGNGEWIAEEVVTGQGADGVSMKGAELVMRSPKGKGKAKVVEAEDRVIMHCDFDSFFVSAGLVDRPQFRGKPVVVCHSQGAQGGGASTSEIASSSYEARELGIKNGMRCRL